MIMQGNVPSSVNNIWAKNQMASGRNELLLACNNKGITRKAFWYRNDVSINLRIDNSLSKIMPGNICAKNLTASERNMLSLASNNKGTAKKGNLI
jgi:hypothetical protein